MAASFRRYSIQRQRIYKNNTIFWKIMRNSTVENDTEFEKELYEKINFSQ